MTAEIQCELSIDRAKPAGKTIKLHAAVVKGAVGAGKAPVVMLAGGPGAYLDLTGMGSLKPVPRCEIRITSRPAKKSSRSAALEPCNTGK